MALLSIFTTALILAEATFDVASIITAVATGAALLITTIVAIRKTNVDVDKSSVDVANDVVTLMNNQVKELAERITTLEATVEHERKRNEELNMKYQGALIRISELEAEVQRLEARMKTNEDVTNGKN